MKNAASDGHSEGLQRTSRVQLKASVDGIGVVCLPESEPLPAGTVRYLA